MSLASGCEVESRAISLLIQQKLADGRLPQNSIPRVWGGAGAGEKCDACEEIITKHEFIMEGVSREDGEHPIRRSGKPGIQFHVKCFQLWDSLRVVPRHQSA